MIRVMVVGCGQIATACHLPALQTLAAEGLVEIVACDIDAAKASAAAAAFGATPATRWEDEVAAVDAVAVCGPPGPNAAIAAAAVRAGKHVLCEKPPGRRLDDALDMAAAAREEPEAVTMVGFNRRYNPLYRMALERSLALGPPQTFSARFSRDHLSQPPSNTASDWITADSCHAIDLAVATIGFPRSLSVARWQAGAGPERAWTLHFEAAGASAVLVFHYGAGRILERYEWAGAGYDVALELPWRAEWAPAGGQVETVTGEGLTGSRKGPVLLGFVDEYRTFLAAVSGSGPRPSCDFEHGARLMGLLETVLSVPPATVREVDFDEGGSGSDRRPNSPPRAAVAATRAPAADGTLRPVVLLHPAASEWPRFFAPDQLDEVSRLATLGDPSVATAPNVIVTGRARKPLPEEVWEQPDLRLVVLLGSSVRGLPWERLDASGVALCNTAPAVALGVAEHCLALMLAGLRHLPVLDREMHDGKWPAPSIGAATAPSGGVAGGLAAARARVKALPLPPAARVRLREIERRVTDLATRRRPAAPPSRSSDLHGVVVGLVGWGHTARALARLLAPFECQLLVATSAGDDGELAAAGARRAALGELLGSAAVVSLHAGLTEETRGLLGTTELDLISPGSVLVNTARAGLVNRAALLDRLRRGDLVAALDVFDEEPLPADDPLRSLPNAILTPHCASTTVQEERRMGAEALGIVNRWLRGEPIPALDRERLARMT